MGFVEVTHQATDWLELRAQYEAYGDYFVPRDNAVEGGGYGLVNVSARIDVPQAAGVSLDLAATNLLDEDYAYLFGGQSAASHLVPGVPRQIRATLRARF